MQDFEVAIIGAGPGGIASAHLLQQNGITDFVILERGDDFGGTWRDNRYPGLAVDIPSLWYQFSFAPNPGWSRLFAPGPEIYQYLRDVAGKLGLYRHLRAKTAVLRQIWDDDAAHWRVELAGGTTITARFLISSVGGYVNADTSVRIDGMADFTGTIMRPNGWDEDYDVRGKRVAVIGTGSSGVQIAAALAGVAAGVDVYQRTPGWILPKVDFDIPPTLSRLFRVPGFVAAVNWAGRTGMDAVLAPLFHVLARLPSGSIVRALSGYDAWCRLLYRGYLRAAVRDVRVRQSLMPRYGILAKRPVISSAFMRAMNKESTDLITTPIDRITVDGVRTVDGTDRRADLIVMATGYELWTDPETYRTGTIIGRNGFDLADYYRTHGMRSYAGTAHPELPNRWEIVGPNGFVGFAWFDYVETMAAHAVRLISECRRRGDGVVRVTERAFDEWNRRVARRGKPVQLYMTECSPVHNTYFLNSQGECAYYSPQTITASRRFSRRSPWSDYEFSPIAIRSVAKEALA